MFISRLARLSLTVSLAIAVSTPGAAWTHESYAQLGVSDAPEPQAPHRIWLPPAHIVRSPSLPQVPVLQITKSDSPDPVTPGSPLQYTIAFTNTGTTAAQNVVITETYDPNVTVLGAVPPPDPGTGATVWSINISSTLEPGESGRIDIFTRVGDSLPVGTVLTNRARISATGTAATEDTETTQVTVVPDLELSKIQESPLGSTVRVSDTIDYVLAYTNTGTALLSQIVVTETYDDPVQFVKAIPTPDPGTNNRRWSVSALNPGQSGRITLRVIIPAPQPNGTPLVNTATIDSSDTNPETVQLPPIQILAPQLSLSKRASASTVQANSLLTYTLRYTNSGGTYASGVVVTDLLPSDVMLVSAVPTYSQRSGDLLTWDRGQLNANSSGQIRIVVLVNNNIEDNTPITNRSRISALENIAATANVTTIVRSSPDLRLAMSDGLASVVAGQVLTYTLTYTNAGNAPAWNVVITDRVPPNLTLQNCVPGCTPVGGDEYAFSLSTLNAGEGGIATIRGKVDSILPAGLRSITNTAGIETTADEDVTFNNFAQDADTVATVPILALGVAFDSRTPYPTKTIDYTVRYTNTSAMHTTGVVISVTKSPYANYVPSGWTHVGGNDYIRSIGNLDAGESGMATFVVSLPFPYPPNMESFANTFLTHDNGPGGLPVATDVEGSTLGVPDLIVESVSLSPPFVTAGTKFTATVVVRNEGTGRACNPKAPSCGSFTVDAFIDPLTPPPSFPFEAYGDFDAAVGPLNPGAAATVSFPNLSFTSVQSFILYFKVDNWWCADGSQPCLPSNADHGLVPESDEENNVFGPLPVPESLIHRVYLPVVLKNAP